MKKKINIYGTTYYRIGYHELKYVVSEKALGAYADSDVHVWRTELNDEPHNYRYAITTGARDRLFGHGQSGCRLEANLELFSQEEE